MLLEQIQANTHLYHHSIINNTGVINFGVMGLNLNDAT